ncbi:DUF6153 family protein [Actinomadura rayongensis]|uniref:Uncharacterized protein n=1 Tax=Actinomadura rayongensis TaxID=1429076 RepID=A0A6I4VW63_9ACTN|nr:DUF6153 family protein [Actinomadura rayongensis]MXQ62559.1 hypothetical protein [Actinomadura rayongensis]
MSISASSRRGSRLLRVLGVVLLLAGLMAMHGFQVTVNTMDASGPMTVHATHAQHEKPSPAQEHRHDHPAGEVCLWLLVALFAFVLAALGRCALERVGRSPARGPKPRADVRGRAPPTRTIFQLAVLRL